jgi:HEAT repeat protein
MKKETVYLIGSVVLMAHVGQVRAFSSTPTPDMTDQLLQEKYHIAPSKEGFLQALQHESPDVRSFAAIRLAAAGQKDAVQPILAALTLETVVGNKIILATAAAQLGADEGVNALKTMCGDQKWSPGLRMTAAQSMIGNLGREDCLPEIVGVLGSSGDDIQAVVVALNLLPRFKQVSAGEMEDIRRISAAYLKSPTAAIRMAASQYIAKVGDLWAASQLKAALQIESDEAIRRIMAAGLSTITQ